MKFTQKEIQDLITSCRTIDSFLEQLELISKVFPGISKISNKLKYNYEKSKKVSGKDKSKVIDFFFYYIGELALHMGLYIHYNSKSIVEWSTASSNVPEDLFRIVGYSNEIIKKVYYATGTNLSDLVIHETNLLEVSGCYHYFIVRDKDKYCWMGFPDFDFNKFRYAANIKCAGLNKKSVQEIVINKFSGTTEEAEKIEI